MWQSLISYDVAFFGRCVIMNHFESFLAYNSNIEKTIKIEVCYFVFFMMI